jgi:hypothetical protein
MKAKQFLQNDERDAEVIGELNFALYALNFLAGGSDARERNVEAGMDKPGGGRPGTICVK